MPTPLFSTAVGSVRPAGHASGGEASAITYTREYIEELGPTVGSYVVRGVTVPHRGHLALAVGDQVTVQWHDGVPTMILDYQVRRGGGADVPDAPGPLIEELFVSVDPKSGLLDVFFRNRDQVTALKLTKVVAKIAAAQFGQVVPVVKWGQTKDRFILFGGWPDNDATGWHRQIFTTLIFTVKITRPEGPRRGIPTGATVRATVLKEYTVAPLFLPGSDIPRQQADLFLDDRGHLLLLRFPESSINFGRVTDVENGTEIFAAEPFESIYPLQFLKGKLTRWLSDIRLRSDILFPAHVATFSEVITYQPSKLFWDENPDVQAVSVVGSVFLPAPLPDPYPDPLTIAAQISWIVRRGNFDSPPQPVSSFMLARTDLTHLPGPGDNIHDAQTTVYLWIRPTVALDDISYPEFVYNVQTQAKMSVRGVNIREHVFFSVSIESSFFGDYTHIEDDVPRIFVLPDWMAPSGIIYVMHRRFDRYDPPDPTDSNDPHMFQMAFLDIKKSKVTEIGQALQFGPLFALFPFSFLPSEAHRLRFLHPGRFYTSATAPGFTPTPTNQKGEFVVKARGAKGALVLSATNFTKDTSVGSAGTVKKLPDGVLEPPDFDAIAFSSALVGAKAYQAVQ